MLNQQENSLSAEMAMQAWVQDWESLCARMDAACREGAYEHVLELSELREALLSSLMASGQVLSYKLRERLNLTEVAFQAQMSEHFESLRQQVGHTRRMAVGLRKYCSF